MVLFLVSRIGYFSNTLHHLFDYVISLALQDLDEFKNILKPRLKLIVQNDEREWFIVFVSKAHPSNDQATKSVKKVYAKLEVDFSSKKRERLGMQIGVCFLLQYVANNQS